MTEDVGVPSAFAQTRLVEALGLGEPDLVELDVRPAEAHGRGQADGVVRAQIVVVEMPAEVDLDLDLDQHQLTVHSGTDLGPGVVPVR